MTPFRFRLERVLAVRVTQFQLAESAYGEAESRLRDAQTRHAALKAAKNETRNSIARMSDVTGNMLEPLGDWFHWTEIEDGRFIKLEKTFADELAKRRQELVKAHGKVRLLEKLRDGRRADWQKAFDREIEEIAADAINSRWVRSRSV